MTKQQVSTNTFFTSKFIVSPTASQGTYTTIAEALAAATSGDKILLREGTYTENITLKAGVDICGMPSSGQTPIVSIKGKITANFTGNAIISDVDIQTNGDYAIESTAGLLNLGLKNCELRCVDFDLIHLTAANSIYLTDCHGDILQAARKYFVVTNGTFVINYCVLGNSIASTGVNTMSAGAFGMGFSSLQCGTTFSGTSAFSIYQSQLFAPDTTAITANNTVPINYLNECLLQTGTASCLSIGAGCKVAVINCETFTHNVAAITGLGTIEYTPINPLDAGSNLAMDTTTQTPIPTGPIVSTYGLNLPFNSSTAYLANTVYKTAQINTGYANLGITYSASTFTITSADQSALSTINYGVVWIPSKVTPGKMIRSEVNANQTFIDDSGASTIVGNLFGFGAGDTATSNDIPFFIYAVTSDTDTTPVFMISRQAGRTLSPAAADIGKTGSAIADTQWAFFALGNPTVASYDLNPCTMVGSFRMRLTTAGGDWTVQALATTDGIGSFQEQVMFDWPVAVNGAAANTHWLANGGTAPVFNNMSYQYQIKKSGNVEAHYKATTTSTAGVGAVQARLTIPMRDGYSVGFSGMIGHGRILGTNYSIAELVYDNSVLDITTILYVNSVAEGIVNNANLDGTISQIQFAFDYYPKVS